MSYAINSLFPLTDYWSGIVVDSLEEAEAWYDCQLKARLSESRILTLYDNRCRVLKHHHTFIERES